ncbi:Lymphocyte cytosolic protein 2 [Lonchura striata]|uniref:Lymphocyte cytosolic protein 2 n=1 Tax=Lonchura striata TaxID=40157 RepID=A0A218UPE7_9PASE|nr:Lymphocyte cytosolic protein 2 [Lonchura striata domestica]
MDLRNVPYRSDVLTWDPEDLAEYFRTNMSENDIQKFPKLRVPWVFKRNQSGPDDDDDDYESPDEGQEKEDEADYESPTEEPEEAEHDSDGYEPPPSNNEEAHHSVIFPAKSLPSSTDYIGKKPGIPEKPLVSQLRSLGEQLAMMPKPPVPPSDRYERGNPPPLRKQSPGKHSWPPHKKNEDEEDTALQRPVPQLSLPPYSSNAFPPKSIKPPPKPGSNSIPAAESSRNLSSTGSLPPRFHPGSNSRSPSRGPADMRPPLPIPSRQTVHQANTEEDEGSLKDEWYVAFVSRPEAEAALRKINKDGTFLVRDSSRKTVTHPYVLMVLYRDKVYNIQIRYQEQDHLYLLGTSLKGKEEFSSVADIIDHFQRTPLLLIDGKDRGSRNQCMLKYAAGHI